MKLLKQRTKNKQVFWNRLQGYAEHSTYENHVAGGEFYHTFEIHAQNRLYIIPKYNMISNVGCTPNGAHATEYNLLPHGIRQIFNMKTYEYEFPLKHPKYVIPDAEYAKKCARIMAVGHPFVNKYRRIESVFLALRYKGLTGIIKRFKKSKSRKKTIEN